MNVLEPIVRPFRINIRVFCWFRESELKENVFNLLFTNKESQINFQIARPTSSHEGVNQVVSRWQRDERSSELIRNHDTSVNSMTSMLLILAEYSRKDCKHKPCSRIRGKSLTLGEILDRQMESGQVLLEKLGTPNCAQYCGGGVSDSKENISVCHSLIRRQNVLQTCIVDLVAKCINNHSAIPVSTKTWWNVIHEFTRLFLSRFYFFAASDDQFAQTLLTHVQDVGRQTIVLQLCWHIE